MNTNKKVLILGVAAVQKDAIIELKRMGCMVYACAMADDGPGSQYVDNFKLLNFADLSALRNYVAGEQFDCVYSVGSDIAMPISTQISEEFGLPHFVSSNSAYICNNKNEMRSLLGRNSKWNINYQVIQNISDEKLIDFPFIMKPSDSQGQRGVKLILDEEMFLEEFNLTKAYSRSGNVIIEEFVDGDEISVNTYLVDGKVVFCVLSDRVIWPQYSGGLIHKHIVPSQYNDSLRLNNIDSMITEVAKKLEIKNGPLYFQIKTKDKDVKIIEVTPRLDGCHMWNVLKYSSGINLIKLTFEHLLVGKVDEIKNKKFSEDNYVLEFLCQTPNTKADYSKFNIPKDVLFYDQYYKSGVLIRPVNGKYEKIGYYIAKYSKTHNTEVMA